LIDSGLEVDAYADAERALTAFNQQVYDIIVTDVVLAGKMSGLHLVRAIRRSEGDRSMIPVLAISSYDDITRRIELFHVGINDYMTKPIIAEEFIFRVANLINTHRMFIELAAERNLLQEIALLDRVTNLYNRNAFNEFGPKALANARRHHLPLSLVVMDIDFFKKVNDEHGHMVGDKVLAEVGEWLRGLLRKGDMIFRWGGEEFVLLLYKCALAQALPLMELQRRRFIGRKFADLSLSASFGISSMENFDQDMTLDQLFERADQAVYQAKTNGRDQVCVYSGLPNSRHD